MTQALPLMLAGGAELAQGAVLASYTFNGGSITSNDSDPNSTAGNFTTNNGGTPAGSGSGVSNTTNMAFFHTNSLTTTSAGVLAAPDYLTFTFTPTGGSSFNLTSLTFEFGGSNAGGTATAYTTYAFLRTTAEAMDYSTTVGTEVSHIFAGPGGGATYDLLSRPIRSPAPISPTIPPRSPSACIFTALRIPTGRSSVSTTSSSTVISSRSRAAPCSSASLPWASASAEREPDPSHERA